MRSHRGTRKRAEAAHFLGYYAKIEVIHAVYVRERCLYAIRFFVYSRDHQSGFLFSPFFFFVQSFVIRRLTPVSLRFLSNENKQLAMADPPKRPDPNNRTPKQPDVCNVIKLRDPDSSPPLN